MDSQSLISFFKEVPLFSHLDNEELEQLSQICSEKKFEKGQTIFYEEDMGTGFYLIMSGQVKIVMLSSDGREHILGLLRENDFFGEMSILDGQPRSATAIALSDIKTMTINREDFTKLLRSNPDMAIKIMFVLCKRLRQADRNVESLAFLSAPGRVARTIMQLADEQGIKDLEKIIINHKMTRQEFASIAGTSRETLTRVLMDFKDEGILDLSSKHQIILVDKKLLKEKIV
ncbi:MAG: Crp/Fnr family transcriptional regulator [Candidatus Sericytochromatia bacterium]|nr:Crp/Fnr family transcriptional regulator [Candidatus Sericytochromatia bacterium]